MQLDALRNWNAIELHSLNRQRRAHCTMYCSRMRITVVVAFHETCCFCLLDSFQFWIVCCSSTQTHMARSMHWFAAFMLKSNAWIGFSFSPLFLISLDAHAAIVQPVIPIVLLILDMRVACVYAATCTSLVNSYHPLLRFLRPFMQFCTTQFGSCLNFLSFLVVILNFHSFRLTLLPITNGWHNFPCIVCVQRIRLVRVGFCLLYPNKRRIRIKNMVMETRKVNWFSILNTTEIGSRCGNLIPHSVLSYTLCF